MANVGDDAAIQSWLEQFIEDEGAAAGTVHRLISPPLQAAQTQAAAQSTADVAEPVLELAASVRIPEPVIAATRLIPKGKGMAGLAWERDRPVQTCNLKTDASGDVRPGARAVDAQAAVAIPVRNEHGQLRAVVGVAFMGERDLSEGELAHLEMAAARLPS